jgi:hypothetical protein
VGIGAPEECTLLLHLPHLVLIAAHETSTEWYVAPMFMCVTLGVMFVCSVLTGRSVDSRFQTYVLLGQSVFEICLCAQPLEPVALVVCAPFVHAHGTSIFTETQVRV